MHTKLLYKLMRLTGVRGSKIMCNLPFAGLLELGLSATVTETVNGPSVSLSLVRHTMIVSSASFTNRSVVWNRTVTSVMENDKTKV